MNLLSKISRPLIGIFLCVSLFTTPVSASFVYDASADFGRDPQKLKNDQ